jgi:hypothetical protein
LVSAMLEPLVQGLIGSLGELKESILVRFIPAVGGVNVDFIAISTTLEIKHLCDSLQRAFESIRPRIRGQAPSAPTPHHKIHVGG